MKMLSLAPNSFGSKTGERYGPISNAHLSRKMLTVSQPKNTSMPMPVRAGSTHQVSPRRVEKIPSRCGGATAVSARAMLASEGY